MHNEEKEQDLQITYIKMLQYFLIENILNIKAY